MNADLVPVRTFSYRHEAERAQQLLQSAGIASIVRGDDASGWVPHIAFGTGGMTLLVNPADFEEAATLLEDANRE
jgi:hypothetical protein